MEEIKNLVYVAIQIKSHEVETGFYKTAFGLGKGLKRRGFIFFIFVIISQ